MPVALVSCAVENCRHSSTSVPMRAAERGLSCPTLRATLPMLPCDRPWELPAPPCGAWEKEEMPVKREEVKREDCCAACCMDISEDMPELALLLVEREPGKAGWTPPGMGGGVVGRGGHLPAVSAREPTATGCGPLAMLMLGWESMNFCKGKAG